MADTQANQANYPQHGNQKKGCGFPMLRLLAVMSLSMGTVVDYAVGAYKGKGTGEQSLLREIFSCIENDDIVLGDRYFQIKLVIGLVEWSRVCPSSDRSHFQQCKYHEKLQKLD